MIVGGLSSQVRMENANGSTRGGDPYLRLFLPDGILRPGQSVVTRLLFKQQPQNPTVIYGFTFLSGQGNP